jgi:hypothetical protein
VELLDTVVAEATAIAVPCFALDHPRRRRRELLVVCRGHRGARLTGSSSLQRVDAGADALKEAVGFDLLRMAGLASHDAVTTRFPGGGARPRRARLRTALLRSGTAGEALDTWTTLLRNRATDLVDKHSIRSEARQVEPYVDGHAVG